MDSSYLFKMALSFYFLVVGLYISYVQVHYQILYMIYRNVLPLFGLTFHFLDGSSEAQTFSILLKSNLSIFLLWLVLLCHI
jgi:hypothetical protein